jgi:hypothetical protein
MSIKRMSSGAVLSLILRMQSSETGPCVLLKAFATRWLRLAVNHLTGELYSGEANAAVGSKLEAKLAQASKIATFSPNKLVDNFFDDSKSGEWCRKRLRC